MGTFGGYKTASDVVTERLAALRDAEDDGRIVVLDYAVTIDGLWAAIQVTRATPHLKAGASFVLFDLINDFGGSVGWGYRPMDESMGPVYYSCPVRLLDKTEGLAETYGPAWRDKVRAWHRAPAARVLVVREAKPLSGTCEPADGLSRGD